MKAHQLEDIHSAIQRIFLDDFGIKPSTQIDMAIISEEERQRRLALNQELIGLFKKHGLPQGAFGVEPPRRLSRRCRRIPSEFKEDKRRALEIHKDLHESIYGSGGTIS